MQLLILQTLLAYSVRGGNGDGGSTSGGDEGDPQEPDEDDCESSDDEPDSWPDLITGPELTDNDDDNVPPPIRIRDNSEDDFVDNLIDAITEPFDSDEDKDRLLSDTSPAFPTRKESDDEDVVSVTVGENGSVDLADMDNDDIVRTGGCGPCIGLLVKTEDNIHVAHLAGPDDTSQSLGNFNILPGDDAVVFGGDNTDGSNEQLHEVLTYLHASGADTSYVNSSGLGMDRDGNLFFRFIGDINNPDKN